MKNKLLTTLLGVVGTVFLILILLILFPFMSDYMGKAFGVSGEQVRTAAKSAIMWVTAAILLIVGAMTLAALPALGVILILGGLATLVYTFWPSIGGGNQQPSGTGGLNPV